MDISSISSRYTVRILNAGDGDAVLALCRSNPQFYEYTEAEPSMEQIRDDMTRTPPDTDPSAKYYMGFFYGPDLVAVMDLIDGYPVQDTAYIGFFMTDRSCQGKGIGTLIIGETAPSSERPVKRRSASRSTRAIRSLPASGKRTGSKSSLKRTSTDGPNSSRRDP